MTVPAEQAYKRSTKRMRGTQPLVLMTGFEPALDGF